MPANIIQPLTGGLIGENISRSRLTMAFEILCKRDNRTLDFQRFDTTRMPGFDFNTHVADIRAKGFTGVTVTHPYKTQADALSDIRDGYPEALGASNLLRFESTQIRSFNTDFTGMLGAWAAAFGVQKPGKVAIAGAGGVARALTAALMQLGATSIHIWDLDAPRATALASRIDPQGHTIHPINIADNATAIAKATGLVNATALGMREYPGMAFAPTDFTTQKWAFDAVYTPLNTEFLQAAKTANLATISGFELFKHMAVRSYAAYTDTKVNPDDVALLDHLSDGL
ncbi:MAG: shikimate dehydrogenase family protein [Paracoccaceae bacterium]